ncbi:MAG: hypothetical protein R2853_09295 [Thermomicrobiales bacterium]
MRNASHPARAMHAAGDCHAGSPQGQDLAGAHGPTNVAPARGSWAAATLILCPQTPDRVRARQRGAARTTVPDSEAAGAAGIDAVEAFIGSGRQAPASARSAATTGRRAGSPAELVAGAVQPLYHRPKLIPAGAYARIVEEGCRRGSQTARD